MLFTPYPPWEDEGCVWDTRKAGQLTKPRGGLPRQFGWEFRNAPHTLQGRYRCPYVKCKRCEVILVNKVLGWVFYEVFCFLNNIYFIWVDYLWIIGKDSILRLNRISITYVLLYISKCEHRKLVGDLLFRKKVFCLQTCRRSNAHSSSWGRNRIRTLRNSAWRLALARRERICFGARQNIWLGIMLIEYFVLLYD